MFRDIVENTALNRRKSPLTIKFLIGLYFFLGFFEPYLNGVFGSITKYYLMVLIVIILFFCRSLNFRYYHFTFALWFVYKFATVFWVDNYHIFFIHVLSHIGMTAFLLLITSIDVDKELIDIITYSLLSGSFIIGVLSLFFSHPYHGIVRQRQVLYLWGCETDPNNQAAFLIIGITIAVYCLITVKKYKALYITMLIINIYSILQTGSRGGLLATAFLLFLLILFNLKIIVLNKKSIKVILLIIFIVVILYFLISNVLPKDIYERLFDFKTYEDGSNRTYIWKNTLNLILQRLNFIFGAGWGQYYGFNGREAAVHNTFLMMFSDVGLIGCLLFFIPLISVSYYLVKRKDYLPVLLFCSVMAVSFFIDAINKRFFWSSIIYLLLIYNYNKTEKKRYLIRDVK